ncbi:MAG: hypothetical protein ACI8UG_001555 [Gammaproteobacteria bacterium]
MSLDLTAGVDCVDAGAYFDGWEYATYQDVRNLLDSFPLDIIFSGEYGKLYNYEQNCANTSTCYALAKSRQNLGKIYLVQSLAFQLMVCINLNRHAYLVCMRVVCFVHMAHT